jgi:hypothetical protein
VALLVPPVSEDATPAERARELQVQLRILRIRERTANFEDKEAIRRAIADRERELEVIAAEQGLPDDVSLDS